MKYLIGFILLLIIGCKQEGVQKYEYYDSGAIKSVASYLCESDKYPFKKISFNEDGSTKDSCYYNEEGKLDGVIYLSDDKVEQWISYKDGHKNGRSSVFQRDGKSFSKFYRNDTLNGVHYRYFENGDLACKILWKDDNPILMNEYSCLQAGDTVMNFVSTYTGNKKQVDVLTEQRYLHSFFILKDSVFVVMGSLLHDKNMEVLNTSSSFVKVDVPDTITSDVMLPVALHGYFGNIKDVWLECKIGSLEENLEDDKMTWYTTDSGNLSMDFELGEYHDGYNVLLGEIRVKRDTTTLEVVKFFEDFYVVPVKM
ncbi:hypothetical protein EYV94_16395 [Puteibacter caeruleilacunae]|nr:hypothetical protein EYV94_16395 [Puteibacter caeruleilacunae]